MSRSFICGHFPRILEENQVKLVSVSLEELKEKLNLSKVDKEVTTFIEDCVEKRVDFLIEAVKKLEDTYNESRN